MLREDSTLFLARERKVDFFSFPSLDPDEAMDAAVDV